jgi:hypothetical protein
MAAKTHSMAFICIALAILIFCLVQLFKLLFVSAAVSDE